MNLRNKTMRIGTKSAFCRRISWLWLGLVWIILCTGCTGCAKIIVCPLKDISSSKLPENKLQKKIGVYLLDKAKLKDSSLRLDADYTEQKLRNEDANFQRILLNTFRGVYEGVHLLDDDPLDNRGLQYELDLLARVEKASIDFSSQGYKQTVTANLKIIFYDKKRAILKEADIHGNDSGSLPKLSGETMQEYNQSLCNLRNNSVAAAMMELASLAPVPPEPPNVVPPLEDTVVAPPPPPKPEEPEKVKKPREPNIIMPLVEIDSFIDSLSRLERLANVEIELKSDSWIKENKNIKESEELFKNASNPDLPYEEKIKAATEAIQILRSINSKLSQIKRDDSLKQYYQYLLRRHIDDLINTEDKEEAVRENREAKKNLSMVYIIDPNYTFESDPVISAIPELIGRIREFYNDIFFSQLSYMKALIDNLKTGNQLFSEGKYSEAEDYYKQAIELVRDEEHTEYIIELKHRLSLFYLEVANKEPIFTQKLKLYNKSLEIAPDIFDAYFNLGVAYYENRQLDKALENFQKCEELESDNKAANNNIRLVKTVREKKDSLIWARGLVNDIISSVTENELGKLKSMTEEDSQNYLLKYLLIMVELKNSNINSDKLAQNCQEVLDKDESFYPARNVLAYLLAGCKFLC